MKTKVLAIVLGIVTTLTFAQKNELKSAEKALKSQDYAIAITAINSAESLIANMDAKTKGKFYFFKAKAFYGKKINEIKQEALKIFNSKFKEIKTSEMILDMSENKIDITQPVGENKFGTLHPLTQITNKIINLLSQLGFSVVQGEEIVSDEYNFEKLNLFLALTKK